MAYSEDHIALAAEYALGTLDADERAQVETMMAVDTEFTAIVTDSVYATLLPGDAGVALLSKSSSYYVLTELTRFS